MSIIRVPITEASRAQLMHFANVHMQLNLPPAANKTTILAAVRKVWDQKFINVDEEALKDVVEDPKEAKENPAISTKEDEIVKVFIPTEDRPGGTEPVPVGVNGNAIYIPREMECFIPVRYYSALMIARPMVFTQDKIDVNNEIKKRLTMAYPVQLLERNCPRAAYEAQAEMLRQAHKQAAA